MPIDSSSKLPRGVVGVIPRNGRLLVIRRSRWVRAPGAYCFPGGGIEVGESDEDALVREFSEEIAANVRPLRQLWRSTTPWNVALAWWLGELASDEQLAADEAEVESIHWFAPNELLQLDGLLESNRDFLFAWQQGEFELEL